MADDSTNTARALFAGGCFWCIEAAFHYVDGVEQAISGYTGGDATDAQYDKVGSGRTSHYEAVEVHYDPTKVRYETLLDTFWQNIDPLDGGGQFADRGQQYHTAIFVLDEVQKQAAEASKQAVEAKFGQKVATKILPAQPFYPAEDYHQDYYKKNPVHYERYKYGSGRVRKLKELWDTEE